MSDGASVGHASPTYDLAECAKFISFWCKVTGAPHLTLTAITPDGPTTTATFTTEDTEKATQWIARHQGTGRNIYFQTNETHARCAKKPGKEAMQAALCRHADIDPMDELHPYQEERNRLHQLADFLRADPIMPPTAILDSGNGIQPLWAVAREPLTPDIVDRVEAENRAIEAATGAAGTHNIDRLLRLPGTLNFPNAKKQKAGRGISRARLLHHSDATYTKEQAAGLGAHLQKLLSGNGLVRLPLEPDAAAQPKEKTGDRDERPKASDPRDSEPPKGDDKPKADTADILTRLNQATTFRRDVQAAIVGACTLKGGSRSEGAFGLGAALKRLGWCFEDMKAALLTCAATRDWAAEQQGDGDRQFRRIWDRSTEQGAGTAWDDPPSESSGPLFDPWAELDPPGFPIEALPPVLRAFVEDRARIIGADPCAIAWAAISAASAALDGSIRLKMKQYDRWSVPPAIWVAIIGAPSTKKSPIIDAAWRPLLTAQEADLAEWRLRLRDWKALPKNDRDPEEPVPHRRLVSHDTTIEAVQTILGRQDRGIGVLRSELAGFIGGMEKYAKGGAADRAFWLQAFDGGANVVDRVARGTIAVRKLLATLCGGIQPERLRQFSDITDDGLWQRFLPIIAGPATRGVDEESGGAVEAYEQAIARMLKVPGNVRAELSRPAHVIRNEVEDRLFELEHSGVLGARFASFVGKLAGYWGRLCLALNYLEPDGMATFIVSEATAKRATILLFESVLPCAARVYAATGGAGADVEATRAVAGYILVRRKERVLASDLSRSVRACRGQPLDVVQRVVSPLVAGGWMVPEREYDPYSWTVAQQVHRQFDSRAESEGVRRAAVQALILGKAGVDDNPE